MLAACAPDGHSGGRSGAAPAPAADRYVAADGTALPLAVWPAARDGPPKAVILGLHGFGDYRNAFEEPAAIWAEDGITTYAYDQRGFGKSPTRGRWPGTDTLVDDAIAVATLLRRYPGVPLYIAGESMGGAVALVAADRGIPATGDPLRGGAALARLARPAGQRRACGSSPTPCRGCRPARPRSTSSRPTTPRRWRSCSKDPLMLRQPRFDMGYGLLDLMDAALRRRRARARALHDAARPGRPAGARASR